jgi:hypothetical protein
VRHADCLRLTLGLLLAAVAAGCGSDTTTKPPPGPGAGSDAAPVVPGAEAGPPSTDTLPPPTDGPPPADTSPSDTRPGDAGVDKGTPPDMGGSGGEVGPAGACGDIMPAPGMVPFESIKRLATTNTEVRVLVYGQSDSMMPWWSQVRDWLKAQYPKGNLVMEQHAKGACASQCLIGREAWLIDKQTFNRVPGDVFAFKPDLIIFQVYGRHDDFDTLVKGFKTGCMAFDDHPSATAHCKAGMRFPDYKTPEILLQTYRRPDDMNFTGPLPMEPPIPDGLYDTWMSRIWIPAVAKRYGAVLNPIWELYWDYMQANHLKAADLLPDGENFTDAGNKLMARLTERHLCYVP